MKPLRNLFFATAILATLPTASIAWNDAGHMTVAAIAYHHLDPAVKSKVDDLLKSHPSYNTWQSDFNAAQGSVPLDEYIFERAATWPDKIRRTGDPFDHPNWHFIDYPVGPDHTAVTPDDKPDDDILFGITTSEDVLQSDNAHPEQKAAHLSWIIHLVGDIHQPLHCANLINDTFPAGDVGGNKFIVKDGGHSVKLHAFWDDLLGKSEDPAAADAEAKHLEQIHPRANLSQLATNTTPTSWSIESRTAAVKYAYDDFHLPVGTTTQNAHLLPDGYSDTAKGVAEERIALAGYRLADELDTFLQ